MQENKKTESCKKMACLKKILTIVVALIILRAIWVFGFMPASYSIQAPEATAASTCPTTDTLIGKASYETAPVATAAGAIASANALLVPKATTEANLAFNDYNCPNPACAKKTQGPLMLAPFAGDPTSSRFTFWAMAATAGSFFTTIFHSGLMGYTWSETVTCN